MQIDPTTKIVFYSILGALGVIGAASPSMFPSYLSTESADIVKTAGLLTMVLSGIAGALASVGSSKPGPLAPQDPEVVVAAQALANAKTVQEQATAKAQLDSATQNHVGGK